MSGSNHVAPAMANFGADKATQVADKATPVSEILADLMRRLRRVKPHTLLTELIGLSDDTAQNRMKGSRKFDVDELADLIRSEHGFDVLMAVMAGHQPKWWRICSPLMEVAEVQRIQAMARKRLRKAVQGALDADRDLAATIAAADVLSDQEFVRPHVDALRTTGGVGNRTVAQTKGRRG